MLGWFRAIMPREDRFFVRFGRHSDILVKAAGELDRLLQGGESIPEADMHDLMAYLLTLRPTK